MTEQEYKEKVRKMVEDYCAPGIEKFNNAKMLQDIFNGLIADAKKRLALGDIKNAKFFVDGAKCFRETALSIFMAHPDYDEWRVMAELAPTKDIKLVCEYYSET